MREVNAVSEPMLVRATAPADVTSKDVAEALLERLDLPRNRGGRRIQSNTPDGQLEIWRDAGGRVHLKHRRFRNEKSDEISIRLQRRGNYIKSTENIFSLKMFLEANDLVMSYLRAALT